MEAPKRNLQGPQKREWGLPIFDPRFSFSSRSSSSSSSSSFIFFVFTSRTMVQEPRDRYSASSSSPSHTMLPPIEFHLQALRAWSPSPPTTPASSTPLSPIIAALSPSDILPVVSILQPSQCDLSLLRLATETPVAVSTSQADGPTCRKPQGESSPGESFATPPARHPSSLWLLKQAELEELVRRSLATRHPLIHGRKPTPTTTTTTTTAAELEAATRLHRLTHWMPLKARDRGQ